MDTIYEILAVVGAVLGTTGTVWSAYNTSSRRPQLFMNVMYADICYVQGSQAVRISGVKNNSDRKIMFFKAETNPETGTPIAPKGKTFIEPSASIDLNLILRPMEKVSYLIAESEDGRVGAPYSRPIKASLVKVSLLRPEYKIIIEPKGQQGQ